MIGCVPHDQSATPVGELRAALRET